MAQGRDPVLDRRADGSFESFEEWARLGPQPPYRSAVFVDARGRRCLRRDDFLRARDEGAFPVRYHWRTAPDTG